MEADVLGVVSEGGFRAGRGRGRPGAGWVWGGTEVGEEPGESGGAPAGGLGPSEPLQGRLLSRLGRGVAAGGQLPPGAGLEQAAEGLGVPGQLLRGGRRVGLEEAFPVPFDDPVQIRLAAAEAGGLGLVAGLLGEAGQAVERSEAARGDRDELLERPTLGQQVPGSGGEPDADRQKILGRQGKGGEALQGLAGPGDVLDGQRQVEPGTPDDRVVRPALQAFLQDLRGLVVATGPGRQVGLGEPDAVVVRRGLRGILDDVPELFQNDGAGGVEPPELLEGADAVGVSVPAVADEPAGLFQSVLNLVKIQQDLAGLLPGRHRGAQSRPEIGLPLGVTVVNEGAAGEHHGRVEGERGPGGN